MPPEATTGTPAAGATPAAGSTEATGATPTAPTAPTGTSAGSTGATPGGAATAQTTTQSTGTDDPQLGDAGRSAIAAERKAAADLRKQLEAVTKERDTLAAANLTELEKATKKAGDLEKQMADLTRQNTEQRIRVATVTAAQKAGYADPEDALRLIDRAAIEFDDATGEPKNIAKLAGDLLKAKPYLASGAGRPTGSQDFGSSGAAAPKIEDVAKGMTPAQFADWLQANPGALGLRR